MLNRVILIGNLTKDPELRYTPQGNAVCNFSIAINERRGENTTATFLDIVAWRQLAETCAGYLTKGRLVAIEGRIQIRQYETQDGQKRKAFEIVADSVKFLEKSEAVRQSKQQQQPAVDDWDSLGTVTDNEISF